MAARRFLAALAFGVLLGVPAASVPPAVSADDAICATKPDQCVTMTVNVSGYLDGHGYDQAGTTVDCDHVAGRFTDSCQWSFGVVTTRVITMTVQANNPAGAEVCIGTQCGFSPQSKDFTLTNGLRGPIVNMTLNPLNGTALTVAKSGSGTGTVSGGDPGVISCGVACTWTYFPNTGVTLNAAPSGNSLFGGWSAGPCAGQGAQCQFTTGSSKTSVTVTANFSSPTAPPTAPPTAAPTAQPTVKPSTPPTAAPTAAPTTKPTTNPVPGPTLPPGLTPAPATAAPTAAPSAVVIGPSTGPTESAGAIETPGATPASAAPGQTAGSTPPPGPDTSPTSGEGEGFPILGILISLLVAGLAVFFVYRRQNAT